MLLSFSLIVCIVPASRNLFRESGIKICLTLSNFCPIIDIIFIQSYSIAEERTAFYKGKQFNSI